MCIALHSKAIVLLALFANFTVTIIRIMSSKLRSCCQTVFPHMLNIFFFRYVFSERLICCLLIRLLTFPSICTCWFMCWLIIDEEEEENLESGRLVTKKHTNLTYPVAQVSVRGRIAYMCQTPFIRNLTVRDNILFGLPYNEKLYRQVIDASALTPDLAVLPSGDRAFHSARAACLFFFFFFFSSHSSY